MWYSAFTGGQGYAESADGVHFRKPMLPLTNGDIDVRTLDEPPRDVHIPERSNIVMHSMFANAIVSWDDVSDHWIAGGECIPQVGFQRWTDLCVAISRDGLHWQMLNGNMTAQTSETNWL